MFSGTVRCSWSLLRVAAPADVRSDTECPPNRDSSEFQPPNLEAGAVSARSNDGPGQTCGERPRRRHPSYTVGGSLPSLSGLRGVRIPTCRTTARSVLRGLQDKHGRLQQRVSHALSRIPHPSSRTRTEDSGIRTVFWSRSWTLAGTSSRDGSIWGSGDHLWSRSRSWTCGSAILPSMGRKF